MEDIFYEGRVFRPPSEAYSLIVQSVIGCSHNTCTFCDMYKEKRFRLRPLAEVQHDFDIARQRYRRVPRVFLADGDALMRPTEEQLALLAHIRATLPECERVTSYATPHSLLKKSVEELAALHEAGLEMVYLGLESGSDEVLRRVHKGATAQQIVQAGLRAREAGMKLSVTAITGLGGQELWQEHAVCTGEALSRMRAEYIGLLTLTVEPGTALWEQERRGEFEQLAPLQTLEEIHLLLEHLDSEGSILRANHISNRLVLKGTLNRDRDALLRQVEDAARTGALRSRPVCGI